jgi:hypothetical protein
MDWTRIPEASKKVLLDGWGYDWENEVEKPPPATVGDLAKMFDESKFFGYMSPDLCTLLMDISEYGLKVQESGVPPRFYMKYLEQVWFLLFMPGKRDGISGYSRDLIGKDFDDVSDEEEEEQRMIVVEIELAQKFDLKLTQDFSQAEADIVDITNRLCGWKASMLHESLETAQYYKAILTLPRSHLAYRAMMQNMMSGIRDRGRLV